mmetsp:Transcript_36127/g.65502  ORF Transcript_36127/g.65502 Transcript_36127/m.65502 type:complete len:1086 (+) Transcript_36127:39-3296(+)
MRARVPGKPARATRIVFVDAFLSSNQKVLAGEGADVAIRGVRAHLFIDGAKFRSLKDSLKDMRHSELPDGSSLLELEFGSSVYDSDSGTLAIYFSSLSGLGSDAAWEQKQFFNDAKLALSYARADKPLVERKVAATSSVKWLENVVFRGKKKADIVYQHPEEMLENETARGVSFPELESLSLSLPVELVTGGALSAPQMQAVCYAARSFKSRLPGEPSSAGGFLLGDGTGCGKGRVISALLAHAATRPCGTTPPELQAEVERRRREGRARRCLWVSLSRDLAKDAERDLSDIGAEALGLRLFESIDKAENCDPSSAGNVLFITYAKLRNEKNAQDVVAWLGGHLAEGLIVFDEAHSAKNFVSGKSGASTLQGRMVNYVQTACPMAPVLYASATACTEVNQMAYMPRLGLWGAGRQFVNFTDFCQDVESRGIAGMEEVALKLKASGVATSRSLSHAGSKLEVLHAPIDAHRVASYDRACGFWEHLQSEAILALAEMDQLENDLRAAQMKTEIENSSDANSAKCKKMPRSLFWNLFWSCQLRFFRQFLVSLKVPEVKRRVELCMAEQGQAVVTLWGTGEAQLVEAQDAEDGAPPPSCPEIMLEQFLKKHFPCPPEEYVRSMQMSCEELVTLLGELPEPTMEPSQKVKETLQERAQLHWSLPANSSNALQLESLQRQDAVTWTANFSGATHPEARRAALHAELLSLQLPQHPLDELLDVLGGPAQVAELSGRSHRLVRELGKWQKVSRQSNNVQEQHAFQAGVKRIAIITEAASTGISLHSDRRRSAIGFMPRQRTLIMAELGFSAEKTMQQLGRVHRSNQEFPPRFEIVLSPVPGETRLASTLTSRLKTLGAVTRGDQRGAGSAFFGDQDFGQMLSAFDRRGENRATFDQLAEELQGEPELSEALARISMDDHISFTGEKEEWTVSKLMQRFLGRSMMLPISVQHAIFSRLQSLLARSRDGSEASEIPQEAGEKGPSKQLACRSHDERPKRRLERTPTPLLASAKRSRMEDVPPLTNARLHQDAPALRPQPYAGRCLARTRQGLQCTRALAVHEGCEGSDFCRLHAREAAKNDGMPILGRIDGPTPE